MLRLKYVFEPTTDYDLIKLIVTTPGIWSRVVPDGTQRENWAPAPNVFYLLVKAESKAVGIWGFVDHDATSLEAHCALLPGVWGRKESDAIFRGMLAWIGARSECLRIVAEIPECNRLAIAYAKRNGMVEYQRKPDVWLRSGRKWPMVCLELKRPF